MAGLVLDASVAVAACLPDEAGSGAALEVILRAEAEGAVAPAIWPTEVANALLMAMRRRQRGLPEVRRALGHLRALDVAIAPGLPADLWQGPVTLAVRHRLSVYDATYLDLAISLGLPLATLDTALRRAAAEEGVAVLPA